MRRNAGFRPPYASRAAEAPVAITFLVAAISAAAATWALVTDSGGRRGPLVEHPLRRRQPFRVPADDDHFDGVADRDEPRPQRGMLRAPCANGAGRLVHGPHQLPNSRN